MCLSAPEMNSLNSHNIIFSQTNTIEEMQDYSDAEMQSLRKDKGFLQILNGGIRHCHLSLRCQVAEEAGRLIYNGRPFNRSQWSWQPPKVIRMQGRRAKEYGDPRNNHPEISILTEGGQVLRLDACPCGGELEMDHNYNLYCLKCFRIYE